MHSARTRGLRLAEDSLREQKKPAKGRRAIKFMSTSEHSRREAICVRFMECHNVVLLQSGGADGDDQPGWWRRRQPSMRTRSRGSRAVRRREGRNEKARRWAGLHLMSRSHPYGAIPYRL